MGYTYLENKELDTALQEYLKQLGSDLEKKKSEVLPLDRSLGRVTAVPVFAKISAPHYYACAMDGIAVKASDTFGATDTTPVNLEEGTGYVVVDTGDPLPEEMDSVIMVEDIVYKKERVATINAAAHPWQHVRQIGEDVCQEEMILPSNMKIEPAAIGAMMAGGVSLVEVYSKPVVGFIPTGDEIVTPRSNPKKGEIIEFNSSIFSSMASTWGCDSIIYDIVPDDLELIKEALIKASCECDIVILNAGSSAGTEDYASTAISQTGQVYTHGIAIRPGKPTILGRVGNKPCIGIPGYPVSGIIVMEHVVKKIVEKLQRIQLPKNQKTVAVLGRRVMSSLKYREFVRMKLGKVGQKVIATPLDRGAGVVTSFVKADGILDIPLNTEGIDAGQEVEISLLRSKDEIENTLVANGSHDPLIDVAYDLLRRRDPLKYVSSSHVGSMGGIMAVKRNETHMAGIHLLDENSGEYNESFVKRYLANTNVAIVKGVKRSQGLMVAGGNPLGIKGIADLINKDLSYVNRQKGSGTRILLDYLLNKQGIDAEDIYGYEREELTHLSVAVQVASGSAHAGLGIYSAAKVYGLDFIPICWETYDFILREEFLHDEKVESFIEVLMSDEFKSSLETLGGYEAEGVGSVKLIRGD
ncbi:molybdopterin biosynthesis protein [Alkalibacter mobilis]|uniref:molybdopterin biosynthesis protein n=1 Tax=Alkalibacter mobilis TaxID=2787712 RepID=UPI00189E4D0B|nr:molybdopterin biosynthesis protein [Alkalibacter mobilis]MBF7096970.1 molybdopterin biosynthesis protein [Alkalibacter mobilis]